MRSLTVNSIKGSRRRLSLSAAGALASCLLAASLAHAQSFPTLKSLVGAWSGSGTLSHQSGQTERINCTAGYTLESADSLQQKLSCHSDTTQFNLVSTIADASGRLSGDWVETTRNAHGHFVGSFVPNGLSGTVQGTGFSAGISIGVRGSKQVIAIRSQGSDISQLRMDLSRSGR